jgi:hypothetical protein
MPSTTLTSELEAINTMLESADEAPVGSLELTGLYPLDKAKTILDETSRVVQAMGWAFNTEEELTLSRDVAGLVALPANMLKFDPDTDQLYTMKPVQRGTRLYDAKAHSYTFTKDVKGAAVFLLGWSDLPQQARHYITIRAARTMQGRSSVSESTYRYSQDDEQAALLGMSDLEATAGNHNMLRDSYSVASILFDH